MDGIYRQLMPRQVFIQFSQFHINEIRESWIKNFSQLYNLIEKNSQNDRKYYQIENFQDSDFASFIGRKYWKQLVEHLVRYKQVRKGFKANHNGF